MNNIINGWASYFKGKYTFLAKKRAKQCKQCRYAIVGTYEILLPDYEIKEIQGLKCTKCGCPLSAKLRSKHEQCPLGKW